MKRLEATELRVLVLAPVGRDASLVGETLHEAGIECQVCPDLVALRVEMQEGAGAIVVTEDLLRAEAVAELGELFAGQLPWSDLPLLIFSAGRETQNGPLEELKKLASYTLIDRPTRKKTLISAVQTALRARRRQYEVRDLLIELEKSVRSRDQFLAMLSHELRNPLAAILTSSQLMERRDPSVFVSERGIVQRQTRLLARLVDDLLDVSRVTLGKIALAPGPVDMGALLERCVKSWMPAAADLGVALTLGPVPASFVVDGDPVRLEQIVSNLLSNAVKYTPRGGHVVGLRRSRRPVRPHPHRRRRRRHRPGGSSAHLRALHTGRPDAGPLARGPRRGPDSGPHPRRAARRHGHGLEPGPGPRQRVRRPAPSHLLPGGVRGLEGRRSCACRDADDHPRHRRQRRHSIGAG